MNYDTAQLAAGMAFPEAPRWHDGAFFVSDHHDGTVSRVQDGALHELCTLPQGASGLGWRPDGAMLVVSMRDSRVLQLAGDGTLVEVADVSSFAAGPLNDIVVDAMGRAYVGSFGSDIGAGDPLRPAALVRIDPDGSMRVVADDLIFPNGMVITPDAKTLIVAESFAFRLTAFDIDDGGDLTNRRTWAALGLPAAQPTTFSEAIEADLPIPDGIALDAEGAVWVSDPRGSRALRVREGGEVVDTVNTGALASYALTLGGAERRTLLICANIPLQRINPATDRYGELLTCDVPVPGAGLP